MSSWQVHKGSHDQSDAYLLGVGGPLLGSLVCQIISCGLRLGRSLFLQFLEFGPGSCSSEKGSEPKRGAGSHRSAYIVSKSHITAGLATKACHSRVLDDIPIGVGRCMDRKARVRKARVANLTSKLLSIFSGLCVKIAGLADRVCQSIDVVTSRSESRDSRGHGGRNSHIELFRWVSTGFALALNILM